MFRLSSLSRQFCNTGIKEKLGEIEGTGMAVEQIKLRMVVLAREKLTIWKQRMQDLVCCKILKSLLEGDSDNPNNKTAED